jgi:hypothetical protein
MTKAASIAIAKEKDSENEDAAKRRMPVWFSPI